MQKIICESCGGTDIIKDGDFFICQSCGVKYIVESDQKHSVNGSAGADKKQAFENLLLVAQRERKNGSRNYREYYRKALEIQPNNWEAYFFGSLSPNGETVIELLFNSSLSDDEKHAACQIIAAYSNNVGLSNPSLKYEKIEQLADSMLKFFPSETKAAELIYINALKAFNGVPGLAEKSDSVYNNLISKIHNTDPNFIDYETEIRRKQLEEVRARYQASMIKMEKARKDAERKRRQEKSNAAAQIIGLILMVVSFVTIFWLIFSGTCIGWVV